MSAHVLLARLDSAGDVLLMGPAVRAVSSAADRVTFLCGPRGRAAAELLPGVDEVLVHHAAWIDMEPEPVTRGAALELVEEVAALQVDEAVVFTSFHQSALPTALLLRMAGVPVVAAASEDYPGSLLDLRHRCGDDLHEVERALSLVAAAGYGLPADDDGRLAVRDDGAAPEPFADRPFVVVHPGAAVPARAWPAERHAELVARLADEGRLVAVTGSSDERGLTAAVTGPARAEVRDLGGTTDLAGLAALLRGAEALVCANSGPAHLAAAVACPVVSLFAPTVPAHRWRPWGVPHALLHRDVPCAGCRARVCPVPGHPCLGELGVDEVTSALAALLETQMVAQ